MKRVKPHEYFFLDFDALLQEGIRQEEIQPSNKGEAKMVRNMHDYFSRDVMEKISSNEWVFEGAMDFVSKYAIECFRYLGLGGREVFRTQQNLLATKQKVVEFLIRIRNDGYVTLPDEIQLVKASDFLVLFDLEELSTELQLEADKLV